MLMPETDDVRCYEAAERLRKAVERTEFVIPNPESPIRKTVSIGCATMQPNDTPETFLKRADVALYEAKTTGRNKVLPLLTESFELSPSRINAREELSAGEASKVPSNIKLAVAGSSGPLPPATASGDAPFVVKFKDSQ